MKSSGNKLQVVERGQVTLPKRLREAYGLKSGSELTLVDLGGIFLLRPESSQVSHLADEITSALKRKHVSLESLFKEIRRNRSKNES